MRRKTKKVEKEGTTVSSSWLVIEKKVIKISQNSFIKLKEDRIEDIYSLGPIIGQGTFSTVRRATHRYLQIRRALKTVNLHDLTEQGLSRLVAEVPILK